MAFTINIVCIKINNLENASALNVGQNLLNDWTNHSKSNMGSGQIIGDQNDKVRMPGKVDDRDMIDMPIREQTVTKLPSLARRER